MSTSQNGYPVVFSIDNTTNYTIDIRGEVNRSLRLREAKSGSALVLCHLALFLAEEVEAPSNTFDWWGWSVRPVRGQTSGYSNHASATAIDFNASQHARGLRNTWTDNQKKEIHTALNNRYNDVIRWGEDFNSTIDGMHFEIDADSDRVQRLAQELIQTGRGQHLAQTNKGLF